MTPVLLHQQYWQRPGDGAHMDIMVLRVPSGILYEMYSNGDRCFHQFSPRPYVPGQACDGTIDSSVFALFYNYCRTKGLGPAALYSKATPSAKG